MFGRHRPKMEPKKRCSCRSKSNMEAGSDMGTKSYGAKNCSSCKTK